MGKWRTFSVASGWASSNAVAAISRSASASPGWLRRYRRPSSPARRAIRSPTSALAGHLGLMPPMLLYIGGGSAIGLLTVVVVVMFGWRRLSRA